MTQKSEEMLRLERDMNEQLQEKLDTEIKRIAEAGEAQSDGEAMVKAAAALGYTITIEELERSIADLEKLDDDELDASGGNVLKVIDQHLSDKSKKAAEAKRRNCGHHKEAAYSKDEHNHDGSCTLSWHCSIAWEHTESNSKNVLCFKDYACKLVVH